jgi:hypothetical protein
MYMVAIVGRYTLSISNVWEDGPFGLFARENTYKRPQEMTV